MANTKRSKKGGKDKILTKNQKMKIGRAAIQAERLRRTESFQKEEKGPIVIAKTKKAKKVRKFVEDYSRRTSALKILSENLLTGKKIVEEQTIDGKIGRLVDYTPEEIKRIKQEIRVLEERLK